MDGCLSRGTMEVERRGAYEDDDVEGPLYSSKDLAYSMYDSRRTSIGIN